MHALDDEEQQRLASHLRTGEGERAELVRSEEEVSFKTRAAPSERARLRKHVVTEHVEKTVPVRREEGPRGDRPPSQEGRIVDVRDADED